MKFHIPFTLSGIDRLKSKPIFFKFVKPKKKSKLNKYLKNSKTNVSREKYLDICLRSFAVKFIILFLIISTILFTYKISNIYLISFFLSFAFAGFTFFSQLVYPRIYLVRKEKSLERNLIPALEDMYIQLNSGIPLYSILVNISSSEYGELSDEFKEVVKRINAGLPQIDVLEEIGEKSASILFRRTLWQISNGMKAGSDISIVISESIKNLNQEQIVQIQTYGSKLNPLILFYMLITVILPALSITFLTIISSMVGLEKNLTMILFIGLFVFVILIHV